MHGPGRPFNGKLPRPAVPEGAWRATSAKKVPFRPSAHALTMLPMIIGSQLPNAVGMPERMTPPAIVASARATSILTEPSQRSATTPVCFHGKYQAEVSRGWIARACG